MHHGARFEAATGGPAAGLKPRPRQRRLLGRDGPLFTDGGMPPTMSMNLQTAVQETVRRHLADPRHVLLTFFNENQYQALACQKDPVVPRSPGN